MISSAFVFSFSFLSFSNAVEAYEGLPFKDADANRDLLTGFNPVKWRRKVLACRVKTGNAALPFNHWAGEIDQLHQSPIKNELQNLINITHDLNFASITRNMVEVRARPQVAKGLSTMTTLRKEVESLFLSKKQEDFTITAAAILDVATAAKVVIDDLTMQVSFPILAPLELVLLVVVVPILIIVGALLNLLDKIFPGNNDFLVCLARILTFPLWGFWKWLSKTCTNHPNLCKCGLLINLLLYDCSTPVNPGYNDSYIQQPRMSIMDEYIQCEFEVLLSKIVPNMISIANEISSLNITAVDIAP